MLSDDVAYLLQDFGSDLTLTRAGAPSYDPATGLVANAAGSTIVVRGVFISYTDASIDGTLVQRGDRRLLISAANSAGAPEVNDTVEGLKILDVQTIAPNGIAIAWTCQVRA